MDETASRERWRHLAFQVWAVIGVLILIAGLGTVLGKIGAALVPFGFALVIVVVLRGPVQWLEKRRVPRALAVALCYLAAILLVTGALLFIIPPLVTQVGAFIGALPGYVNRLYILWTQVTEPSGRPVVPQWVTTAVLNIKDTTVASLGSWSSEGLTFVFVAGSQAVTGLINLVLALIIGFYTLMDLPKLRVEALSIVPTRYREEAGIVVSTVMRVLGGWMRGAMLDSLVVGTLIAIGLSVLGVPYAVAIGIIGGLFNVVPYLGPTVAAVLAGLAGFFVDPWKALWAVAIVVVVQQFDSLWLNPRIMSQNVDLHPVLVVFSLLTGATLFGVPGLLLAVPVAAIVKGLFVWFFERRTRRSLCTEDGALFRSPRGESEGEGSAGKDAPV
ncbi:MAG TPA: AI-2E family transporter [Coriobacteriia bacterium]